MTNCVCFQAASIVWSPKSVLKYYNSNWKLSDPNYHHCWWNRGICFVQSPRCITNTVLNYICVSPLLAALCLRYNNKKCHGYKVIFSHPQAVKFTGLYSKLIYIFPIVQHIDFFYTTKSLETNVRSTLLPSSSLPNKMV